MPPAPTVVDLGRAGYAETRTRMFQLADRVRKREVRGQVLLVEHDPVYTAGRATPAAELFDGVIQVERGGRLTYHGPGQLVVYPVLPLPERDARAWLRRLERLGVAVCAALGLTAAASADGTGVFVGRRKVISIGVAIRHWVSTHGLAINVDMDLTPFTRIRPCGLDPERMSDLSREAGRKLALARVADAVRAQLDLLVSPAAARFQGASASAAEAP